MDDGERCYPDGGIVDDLLVYKISDDEFLLVINASNIEKDFNWMKENNKFGVTLNNRSDDYSLLAVQGPNSGEVLKKLVPNMPELEYYHFTKGKVAGIDMIISRTGYTGELGYELYFTGDVSQAEKVWEEIFKAGKEFDIQPVGLAARVGCAGRTAAESREVLTNQLFCNVRQLFGVQSALAGKASD